MTDICHHGRFKIGSTLENIKKNAEIFFFSISRHPKEVPTHRPLVLLTRVILRRRRVRRVDGMKLTKINRNAGGGICPSDTFLARTDPELKPNLRVFKIKMICAPYKD